MIDIIISYVHCHTYYYVLHITPHICFAVLITFNIICSVFYAFMNILSIAGIPRGFVVQKKANSPFNVWFSGLIGRKRWKGEDRKGREFSSEGRVTAMSGVGLRVGPRLSRGVL